MELQFALFLATVQVLKDAQARMIHENEVMQEPQIMCMEKTIGLAVDTRHPFFGRIFVNGMSDNSKCVRQFNSRYKKGMFEIPFGDCEMRMNRVGWPRPGIEYSTTMMVSFHSDLLTETDRVFHVKCRYYQTDKSIGSFFEVSMLPTMVFTSDFPMPNCKYTLHIENVNGPQAEFARIGDRVVHRWECDSDLYGIKVKSCFVDDGRKRRYQLIDATGCANDRVILPDVTYDSSLRTAYVQTHVFKFADKAHVFFQCQITLCLKEQNGCQGVSPPNCGVLRYRRSLNNGSVPEDSEDNPAGFMDISSKSLVVLDPADEKKFENYVKLTTQSCRFCLPGYGFAALVGVNLLTLTIATVTSLALCRRQNPLIKA